MIHRILEVIQIGTSSFLACGSGAVLADAGAKTLVSDDSTYVSVGAVTTAAVILCGAMFWLLRVWKDVEVRAVKLEAQLVTQNDALRIHGATIEALQRQNAEMLAMLKNHMADNTKCEERCRDSIERLHTRLDEKGNT